jgi:transposase InsO family protein
LVEACGMDETPKYLLRDRDAIYRKQFSRRVQTLGIAEVITAYRSPWQNPYAERIIGSIRRECLDHVIVLRRRHLKRILTRYVDYYNGVRTHLSLYKDAPIVDQPNLLAKDRLSNSKRSVDSTTTTCEKQRETENSNFQEGHLSLGRTHPQYFIKH